MYTGTILSDAMPNHMTDRSAYDSKNRNNTFNNKTNAAKFLRARIH
jgi:hypothetical protein